MTTESINDKTPLWFKIAAWSFPLWWSALYIYSYASAFFTNPQMDADHPSGVAFTLLSSLPPIAMLIFAIANKWFRKRLIVMLVVWIVTPMCLLSVMGLTQGALKTAFTRALSEIKSQMEKCEANESEQKKPH